MRGAKRHDDRDGGEREFQPSSTNSSFITIIHFMKRCKKEHSADYTRCFPPTPLLALYMLSFKFRLQEKLNLFLQSDLLEAVNLIFMKCHPLSSREESNSVQ